MEDNQIINLLGIVLIFTIVVFFALLITYVVLLVKSKQKEKPQKKESATKNGQNGAKGAATKQQTNSPSSIYEFMEFEDIVDNMIVQKEKGKYIMIIECQGINYDLMSGIEKTSVEEGFIQFLNTLRHPIQLYIQTRTINLEGSISRYRARVNNIEKELYTLREEYIRMQNSGDYSKEEMQKKYFDLTRLTNLYEYGKDIINNTEDLSLNRNILTKKYYVVVPYYASEMGENSYDKDEMRNMAFSELYNRAQSIIRSLSASEVMGRILNTKELIELMYIAYNRDHEETFNFDKALMAHYDKLYSTSEDVFEKRSRELDRVIEEKALEKAQTKVDEARTESEKRAKKKEEDMDNLINELAKMIVQENKRYIGDEVAERAIEKITEDEEGGEDKNGKKK